MTLDNSFLGNSGGCLYRDVADLIFGVDISMANLECPVFPEGNKEFRFSFNSPPPLFYDLDSFNTVKGYEGRNFSFMATACNHSLDFGMEGIESTVRTLEGENISFNGVNLSESEAYRASILDKHGMKLGVFAYTFGLNAFHPPENRPHAVNCLPLNEGVDAIDFTQIKEQIRFCYDEKVDLIITHLHWGLEHEYYPTPEQIELAHYLAEMGVDLIIGHHPHVIQPVEFYRTKRDENRIVPVYYSLGNLVNAFSAPFLCKSAVANLHLVKGTTADGREQTYIKEAEIRPVFQKVDSENKALLIQNE